MLKIFKFFLQINLIIAFFGSNFCCFANASTDLFKGSAQKDELNAIENKELFTGSVNKLSGSDILIMNVSQVIDSTFSKEGDEFFAEVVTDVEGKDGIIIPAGTIAHGFVEEICNAKRLGRNGAIDLKFDYLITPDGREISIKGKMSTRLHPTIETTKIIATDLGYTAAGSAVGGVLGLAWFGLSNAALSQGATIAGGAAVGGSIGLGMALYRKGKDVLISQGDEIRVKINTKEPLPVYKKNVFLQHEIYNEGLEVKINDIKYDKDPYGEANMLKLYLTVVNNTDMEFSVFNIALVDNFNTLYYPALFGDEDNVFKKIKPGDKISGEIPFSVNNVKNRFWLVFYNNKKVTAKLSINNAYKSISTKSKKQNSKISKNKNDFYKEKLPFQY